MHTQELTGWEHEHVFDLDRPREGERRTRIVMAITLVMMVVEIAAGLAYGSMALLADGLHMGSHATALGVAVFAYVVSRRMAADPRFAFGVGKISSLAGFASAVMLLGFTLVMVTESTERLFNPLPIAFDQALLVAVVGLVVNGLSAWLLSSTPDHHHHAGHHDGSHHHHGPHHHHDHNLRAAYLHVLADALTSLLAIVALLSGKYLDAMWLDPAMGLVGAALVARWSYGLIRDSARVLLDWQADERHLHALRNAIEARRSDKVADLHVWSIGDGIFAAEVSVVSDDPQSPDHYKSLLADVLNVVHATVEVHQCEAPRGAGSTHGYEASR